MLIASQLSVPGLYLPPELKYPVLANPPHTIISLPVQIAETLEKSRVVDNALAFRIYMRMNDINADLRAGKKPSTAAGEFVREEMEHIRRGKHGARSAKQAIAIGLAKARRAGVKLPPPPPKPRVARGSPSRSCRE